MTSENAVPRFGRTGYALRMMSLRFGLSRLLLFVAVAALICWWCFIGMSIWQTHRVRQFVHSASERATTSPVAISPQRGCKFIGMHLPGNAVRIEGGIVLEMGGAKVLADHAICWRIADKSPTQFYLEGNVRTVGVKAFGAIDSLFFDADTGKCAIRRRAPSQRESLIERADELRRDVERSGI
ncbi:MAG: hypothetical protein KDB23_15100 [Planctomycetales bacterium]|nr:hypothetical protein [Planctomycetales bacterium]